MLKQNQENTLVKRLHNKLIIVPEYNYKNKIYNYNNRMSYFMSFIGGTVFGAYIAQNYNIINIKNTGEIIIEYINSLEKKK